MGLRLVVQWLGLLKASTTAGTGFIPGQGTESSCRPVEPKDKQSSKQNHPQFTTTRMSPHIVRPTTQGLVTIQGRAERFQERAGAHKPTPTPGAAGKRETKPWRDDVWHKKMPMLLQMARSPGCISSTSFFWNLNGIICPEYELCLSLPLVTVFDDLQLYFQWSQFSTIKLSKEV